MSAKLKTGNENQDVERSEMSRRKFIKAAGIGALAGPLLIRGAGADDIAPNTLKDVGKQFADVTLDEEEAIGASKALDPLTKILRGIDIGEEVEPVTIFSRRREK